MEKSKKGFRLHLKLETIVFIVIAIYVFAYAYKYFSKDTLAVYEVTKSDLIDSIETRGVIIREEELIKTDAKGYICYYFQEGSRIRSGGTVYLLDKSGKVKNYISSLSKEKGTVDQDEKDKVYEQLESFTDSYRDEDFASVYEAKNDIQNKFLAYTDSLLATHRKELTNKFGEDAYAEAVAPDSGLVYYTSDGLEGTDIEEINKKSLKADSKFEDLRTEDVLAANKPVYRLITSQKWQLVIPLKKNERERFERLVAKNEEEKRKNRLEITIHKDNLTITVPFKLERRRNHTCLILSFDNYVKHYINQRKLDISILLSEQNGYKIPTSSLTTKKVYRIPVEFLSKGGNSKIANMINVPGKDEKGVDALIQHQVTIHMKDSEYAYIDMEGVEEGTIISNLEQTKMAEIKEVADIQGVFFINRGYAVFRAVDILETNSDYCIISEERSNLQLYDRIILNSNTIRENQVIY